MLSAPMLCWRKDNTVLQPAEMTSQHSICISKPWLNSAAICACVRGRVLVLCMSELHVLADPHSCTCCAAISLHTRRQVVPGPPQLYFFPDKLAHCFLETIMIIKKKKPSYSAVNISANLIRAVVGAQALIPSVILSLRFQGAVAQRQASRLSGQSTPQELMGQWQQTLIPLAWAQPHAPPHLPRPGRWKQRHRDWKAAFYVLPQITEQSERTASCVLCLIGHARVEVQNKQLNIHEAKKEPHIKNMQTLGCCS